MVCSDCWSRRPMALGLLALTAQFLLADRAVGYAKRKERWSLTSAWIAAYYTGGPLLLQTTDDNYSPRSRGLSEHGAFSCEECCTWSALPSALRGAAPPGAALATAWPVDQTVSHTLRNSAASDPM